MKEIITKTAQQRPDWQKIKLPEPTDMDWTNGIVRDEWEYKGNKIRIVEEREPDNKKFYHYVLTPNGEKLSANISPYNKSRKTVELWIDAGYPEENIFGVGTFEDEDLLKIIKSKSN